MTQADPVVYVVDDDDSVRKGLDRMLRFAGFRTLTFASAEGFLTHDRGLSALNIRPVARCVGHVH